MNNVLIPPAELAIRHGAGDLPALEIRLGGTPRGLVLVVCEPGTLDADAPEVMNRLAEHGYESLAAEVTPETARRNLDAMFARAAHRQWAAEQIAILGWGSGGRAVLDAATRMLFGAAVSISPTPPQCSATAVEQLADVVSGPLETPWLGLLAADDPCATEDSVSDLTSALDASSTVHAAIVRYPGVDRTFYRHTSQDGLGHAAWYDGWQRTMEWLEARVAPRLTPLAAQWRSRSRLAD